MVGEPRLRLTYLDGIRAVAAMFVALHHIWLGVWDDFPANAGPWWTGWLLYGHIAVAVFIVLSGFSLAIEPVRNEGRLRGGNRRFFRRRAWRILPAYWAALAVSIILIAVRQHELLGPDGTVVGYQPVTVKSVVVHGLLLQDVIGSPSPNGAFWSIAIEWQIYFLFPLLLWWHRRFSARTLIFSVLAVVIVSQYLSLAFDVLSPIQGLTPQFLALFVFGMVAADVLSGPPRPRRWALAGAAAGTVVLVAWAWIAGSPAMVANFFWVDLAAGVCTALLLAGLVHARSSRLRSLFETRFLRWTGRFSYSIYLVHSPILLTLWYFAVVPMRLEPVPRFLVMLALGMPAVIFGSWLFSRLFEEPFLRHRSWASLREAFAARWAALRSRLARTRPAGAGARAPDTGTPGPEVSLVPEER
ncbi:acyltransferase family protein [Planobispora siamensis]|uniref:Acyltransferase 3 domain-containing protein n=1 Tax=Planobispora siamensis TaxID=936338 RepID=A0A8J3WIX7_9ACTN|nr:acyltransferase [Planobispora siamensis]GIH91038.1 hypothetical protein Psi01_16680 [Planobispora siamensis]